MKKERRPGKSLRSLFPKVNHSWVENAQVFEFSLPKHFACSYPQPTTISKFNLGSIARPHSTSYSIAHFRLCTSLSSDVCSGIRFKSHPNFNHYPYLVATELSVLASCGLERQHSSSNTAATTRIAPGESKTTVCGIQCLSSKITACLPKTFAILSLVWYPFWSFQAPKYIF